MVNADRVAAKLAELGERMARARSHCPATPDELARDRDALDVVAFNLMLAVQSCLDIASHVIADEGWPPATTLASAFTSLRDHGVLESTTADALGRAAGLRNVVAHGYAGIDVAKVHAGATQGLRDLELFRVELARWVQARTFPKSGAP
jgi:uncharacterized protein YutE (UPF0331/DUF86 family)